MIKTETKRPNPVKTLRLMGCKVKVNHWRFYDTPAMGYIQRDLLLQGEGMDIPDKLQPNPRGGTTEVTVTLPNGSVYNGASACSEADNYCKKTGVALCLDRLKKV